MLHLRTVLSSFKVFHQIRNFSVSPLTYNFAKEIRKNVDPYCRIKVECNCNLEVVPYDLLDCPDSNILKASLSNAGHNLNVEVTDKEVIIKDDSLNFTTPPNCRLEIPIKANLHIQNSGSTSISNLYSDEIKIQSSGNINTKSLQSRLVELQTADGNVSCMGTTLAQTIRVIATGKGNIILNKLQGDELHAETNLGNIDVNSCYSNNSSFATKQGDLLLKSIHKTCQVTSGGHGKFVMNGFYGTLNADVASREVSLQLSEIVGKNKLLAKYAESVELALSETVDETTEISIQCGQLEVQPGFTGEHHGKLDEHGKIVLGNKTTEHKLIVESSGLVVLKKMSWADTFGFAVKSN